MRFTVATSIVFLCLVLSATSEEAQNLKTRIHSKDYLTAKAAVEEASQHRNVNLVCEALAHPSLQIRLIAVGEIQKIGNSEVVQSLLDALRANQAKYTGGSETEVLQNELNSKIILELQKLTKLDLNEKHISRVINDVEIWTKANARTKDTSSNPTNQPSKNE